MIAMAVANDPDVLIADEPTTALDATVQAQILDLLRTLTTEMNMAMVLISHDLGVVAGLADDVAVMYCGRVVERGPADDVFHRSRHPYTTGPCSPRAPVSTASSSAGAKGSRGCPRHRSSFLPGARSMTAAPTPNPAAVRRIRPCAPSPAPKLPACSRRDCHRDFGASEIRSDEAAPSALARSRAAVSGRADADGPLLRVQDLVKDFPVPGSGVHRPKRWVQAVGGVSFDLLEGETLALVGESGCGKSTVARCVLRLVEPSGGAVVFLGEDVLSLPPVDLRLLRRQMQIVFQDSSSTLDPRMTIASTISEPLVVNGDSLKAATARVDDLLALGQPESRRWRPLSPSALERPASTGGVGSSSRPGSRPGRARRAGLGPGRERPAGVLDLLERLRGELGLTYLLVAHDLSVVSHIAHRVAVMYMGQIVEVGLRADVMETPAHPYTVARLLPCRHRIRR